MSYSGGAQNDAHWNAETAIFVSSADINNFKLTRGFVWFLTIFEWYVVCSMENSAEIGEA